MNNRVEIISQHAQKIPTSEIAKMLGLSPLTVRKIACKHGIVLRSPAPTFNGNECPRCNTTLKYVSCGACVECLKEKRKGRYLSIETNNLFSDINNLWLMRSWV